MNKVLIKLYVPTIEQQYNLWVPLNKQIYTVIRLLVKAVYEFTDGYYNPKKRPVLYDKLTATAYDVNKTVKECGIKNGVELIML